MRLWSHTTTTTNNNNSLYILVLSIKILTIWNICLQSVIARATLNNISDRQNYVPVFINFSAQTSSSRTQEMIEAKLEKRRKNVIGRQDFCRFWRCCSYFLTLENIRVWLWRIVFLFGISVVKAVFGVSKGLSGLAVMSHPEWTGDIVLRRTGQGMWSRVLSQC